MRPRIGLICDRRIVEDYPTHLVLEQYIEAARDGAGGLPLLLPSLTLPLAVDDILSACDGFLFTGSPSNVDPAHYGGAPARAPELADSHRDSLALPLIRAAIAAEKPVLAICRGFQELNVALGGSLHQHVQEIPGRIDHRERDSDPLDVQWGPAHEVTIAEGGLLAAMTGMPNFAVNSLHGQGIDRLAEGLQVEAVAPDGQIEAVSLREPKGFLLGVQWHPEWQWQTNPVSQVIFAAFGAALSAS